MAIAVILIVVVIALFAITKLTSKPAETSLTDKAYALTNSIGKLKGNVDMFRAGIFPERLQRGADKNDLEYYVGYIAALARCIAEADGIPSDGVILSTVQMEASRLLGSSSVSEGSYAEGIEILPAILATDSAKLGLNEGESDGKYVVDRNNSGPYFGKLRQRFDVKLPKPSP